MEDLNAGEPIPAAVTGDDPGEAMAWGSDVIAALLRALNIPYIALVPGSSFRGLHDSLVNYLGNHHPQLVLCLHEEHAVAIADGYAKVTDAPMAAALHANVGLMHAAMAIYNAWCDRRPMLLFGGNGPLDADRRRPWIDWVHTCRDPGALIRAYSKWDDQPGSPRAAVEAVLRAWQITCTPPHGPVYVSLDVLMQEQRLQETVAIPPVQRFQPPMPPAADEAVLQPLMAAIERAESPLLLFGRVTRSPSDWTARIRLAEAIGGAVMTSLHNAAAFPTDHPLHVLPTCGEKMSDRERQLIRQADLILSFDWYDLAGFLRAANGAAQTQQPLAATIVHCSLDMQLANGWSQDYQALPAVDIPIATTPDALTAQLLSRHETAPLRMRPAAELSRVKTTSHDQPDAARRLSIDAMAAVIDEFTRTHTVTLTRVAIGWPNACLSYADPLSYLGKDSGGAVGTGPGHCVGAALALKDSGRMVMGVLGDGDCLMGINALWTAAHMRLPLLIVVANNQSYFNDELHQERVARHRDRPVENRWIGQKLDDPAIDLVAMAQAQGWQAAGPVHSAVALRAALQTATDILAQGGCCLIDVHIEPGYSQGETENAS